MEKYITLNIVVEFICLVCAVLFLLKDRSAWRMMVAYLAVVVAVEATGKHFSLHHLSNSELYNLYLPVEAAFVGYTFYTLLQKKAWIISGLFLFLLSFVLELSLKGFTEFLFITNIISSVVIVLYALYYFYELLKDDEYYDLRRHAPFWWVAGTLLFYFGSTLVNLFMKYLRGLRSTDLGFDLRYYITTVLILILYSCWSYSFVCRYRQRRLSSLSPLEHLSS